MTLEQIKNVYSEILNDEKIADLYNKINEKINYVIDHGKLHIKHVTNYIKQICKILNIDQKTKYLSLIAGMLHDIGRLKSNENHADEGAKDARQYLKNKLEPAELEIVVNAIFCHNKDNFDYNSNNDVSWILFWADKLDNTRSRYIKALLTDKAKKKISYNIYKFELKKQNDCFNVNMILFKEETPENMERCYGLLEEYVTVLKHFNVKNIKTNIIIKN